MVKRVVAYCRVSTDQLDQLNSFKSQQLFFRKYIEEKPEWNYAGVYSDEGITGTSVQVRAGFLRMIADAQAGLFDLIITKEVSRFSRNILDAIGYTRQLKTLGVGVIFLNDGISTLEPDAELRLGIMAAVAQEESRKTSERVKWGQRHQMASGVVFGRALLGYTVKNGALSIEPLGAALVQKIYSLYLYSGLGVRAIADHLTQTAVITATGKSSWTGAAILKILRNEKYCGDLKQRKTVTVDFLTHKKIANHNEGDMIYLRDHHTPIIPRVQWDAVQQELNRRSQKMSQTTQSCGTQYALSGRINCAVCGAVYRCRTRQTAKGITYRVWRRSCICAPIHKQLRECDITALLREIVAAIGSDTLLKGICDRVLTRKGNQGRELDSLRAELLRIEEHISRLTRAYIQGDISRGEYLTHKEELASATEVLKKSQIQLLPLLKINANSVTVAAQELASGQDADDTFYLQLIELITVRTTGQLDVILKQNKGKFSALSSF